jgi:hypothetical protein
MYFKKREKSRKALSAFTATRAEGRGDAHGCRRVGAVGPDHQHVSESRV